MPASASEWVALLGINILSGILVGSLIRRTTPTLVGVTILVIFNPVIVYFLPPLVAGHDLAEHRAWAGLIIPKLFVLGLPLVLVPAAAIFFARHYVSRKAKS